MFIWLLFSTQIYTFFHTKRLLSCIFLAASQWTRQNSTESSLVLCKYLQRRKAAFRTTIVNYYPDGLELFKVSDSAFCTWVRTE